MRKLQWIDSRGGVATACDHYEITRRLDCRLQRIWYYPEGTAMQRRVRPNGDVVMATAPRELLGQELKISAAKKLCLNHAKQRGAAALEILLIIFGIIVVSALVS